MVVGASTAAAVDTVAAGAMCVEGESRERRRGAEWVVRRGQEEERARGTREGGRKRRCHSFGRSDATEVAGFGIGGGGGRSRGFALLFWAFGGWDVADLPLLGY